jgi:dephospho-CoA kinase
MTYMNKKGLYLIEGLSGTGKTSVSEALVRHGYNAIDADEVIGFFGDPVTLLPTQDVIKKEWLWDEKKFKEVADESEDTLFICGGAMNQESFSSYFEKVFTLQVDDKTLTERLMNRTNNDYGKDPKELQKQLEWNKGVESWSRQRGTILINASHNLDMIVEEIIKHTKV